MSGCGGGISKDLPEVLERRDAAGESCCLFTYGQISQFCCITVAADNMQMGYYFRFLHIGSNAITLQEISTCIQAINKGYQLEIAPAALGQRPSGVLKLNALVIADIEVNSRPVAYLRRKFKNF